MSEPPVAPIAPTIVGSAKATTPATLSANQSGTTVVIPAPVGTQAGDLLLAATDWVSGAVGPTAIPSGWTQILDSGAFETVICSRIATAGEPADYTWEIASANGFSRTGCMISIRGANPTLGDSGISAVNTLIVPDLTNNVEDSILVAFCQNATAVNAENWVANAPLVEQTQHVSGGAVGYSVPQASIIAVEEGLSVGVISGRSFVNTGGNAQPHAAGIIIEPS